MSFNKNVVKFHRSENPINRPCTKYKDLKCRVCGVADEIYSHLVYCDGYLEEIQELEMDELDKNWIFGEDLLKKSR